MTAEPRVTGRIVFSPHGHGWRLDVATVDGRVLATTFDADPLRPRMVWMELAMVCRCLGPQLQAPRCAVQRGVYRCVLDAGHAGGCAFHGWGPAPRRRQSTGSPVDTNRLST